jgi:hypothetical protein
MMAHNHVGGFPPGDRQGTGMRRLAAVILIGSLASFGSALAETKAPDAKGPKDVPISGEFTPARINADKESDARKQQAKGPQRRGRSFYFVWRRMTPEEFEALGRNIVFLIAVWTQKAEELPVKRVFLRTDGNETPIYKVSSWTTPVDANSLAAKIFGTNREDGFYLVPGGAMLRNGQISMDLNAERTNWILVELPSTVAAREPKHFPNLDPVAEAKPNLQALQAFVRRRFPGFPVPQSLH